MRLFLVEQQLQLIRTEMKLSQDLLQCAKLFKSLKHGNYSTTAANDCNHTLLQIYELAPASCMPFVCVYNFSTLITNFMTAQRIATHYVRQIWGKFSKPSAHKRTTLMWNFLLLQKKVEWLLCKYLMIFHFTLNFFNYRTVIKYHPKKINAQIVAFRKSLNKFLSC